MSVEAALQAERAQWRASCKAERQQERDRVKAVLLSEHYGPDLLEFAVQVLCTTDMPAEQIERLMALSPSHQTLTRAAFEMGGLSLAVADMPEPEPFEGSAA